MPEPSQQTGEIQTSTWVNQQAITAVLSSYSRRVRELADRGEIRTMRLEGGRTRYRLEDALRLRREATR
jgi:hypothetical protein